MSNNSLLDDDLVSVGQLTSLDALQAFTDAFIDSFAVDLGKLSPNEKSRLIGHATQGLTAAIEVAKTNKQSLTVDDVNSILRDAEEAGYINEDQFAQLAGLLIAKVMLKTRR